MAYGRAKPTTNDKCISTWNVVSYVASYQELFTTWAIYIALITLLIIVLDAPHIGTKEKLGI